MKDQLWRPSIPPKDSYVKPGVYSVLVASNRVLISIVMMFMDSTFLLLSKQKASYRYLAIFAARCAVQARRLNIALRARRLPTWYQQHIPSLLSWVMAEPGGTGLQHCLDSAWLQPSFVHDCGLAALVRHTSVVASNRVP
ncbi:hypothetical protein J6590_021366 [Homalodisca vitripennis]|nr:hypothetical protein J6590_021366 [Homalodisca vitripennis]